MTDTWYLPPAEVPPDTEWTETLAGGHALVLEYATGHALVAEYGDCAFDMACQCGWTVCLGLRPDESWIPPVIHWLAHVPDVRDRVTAHCQCGAKFMEMVPAYTESKLNMVAVAWERHTMTEVRES